LKPQKPVIFAALDEGAPFDFPQIEQLRSLAVPCFPSPERALRALARISGRTFATPSSEPAQHLDQLVPSLHEGVLSEVESKQLLAPLGIRVPSGALAATPQDALEIANKIGYPVVLKAQSPLLPHKSDVGGVILDISSDQALLEAWHALHRNVRSARPELTLDGVLVERMSEPSVELILGARNDPQWGPVLLVGSGGVLAEALHDTRLLPSDLSPAEIEQELGKLRCGSLLQGFRGAPPRDISSAAQAVSTIAQLIRNAPQIVEIDINPLVVYPRGKGAIALDALIVVAPAQPSDTNTEGDPL
jgi:acyl-CoA synthetase (NDP forming)